LHIEIILIQNCFSDEKECKHVEVIEDEARRKGLKTIEIAQAACT
jgi:hypothetical protein